LTKIELVPYGAFKTLGFDANILWTFQLSSVALGGVVEEVGVAKIQAGLPWNPGKSRSWTRTRPEGEAGIFKPRPE
jgi:hypothetical protein